MNIKDIGVWKCNRCKIIIPPCTTSFHSSDYIFCSESCQHNNKYINKFLIYKFNKKILEFLKFNEKINSINEVKNFNAHSKSFTNLYNIYEDIENNNIITENRIEFKKIISKQDYFNITFKNYDIFINKLFCIYFIPILVFIYFCL